MTADDLPERARSRLDRLDAGQANAAGADGALLRAESQAGVTAWSPGPSTFRGTCSSGRLDPASDHRDPDLARPDAHVIVMCDEGYQSSLAAEAWRAAGLPVEPA
jgi:hypothetical protein